MLIPPLIAPTAEAPPRPLPLLERVAPHHPQSLVQAAGKALRAHHGGLVLLSSEGEAAEFLPYGLDEEMARQVRRSAWLGGLTQLLTQSERPVRLAQGDAKLLALPSLAASLRPSGPLLGVALGHEVRTWGVLYLARAAGAPDFFAEDEETLLALCGLLKQGSLADEGQLIARLRLLTELAQTAAGSLDLTRVFAVALGELDRHLPSSGCALWLTDDVAAPGTAALAPKVTLATVSVGLSERGKDWGLTPGLRLAPAETCFAASLESSQAVYADWGRPEERQGPLAARLAAHGATACFAVPLRAGERTVGILQSICLRPLGFTNAQVQLLYLVADLLGPAISNCQLFNRLHTAYEDLRLTQQKLIHAEKMRALGELAGSMAHEFNNALCGALGFLELTLSNPDLDAISRGYLTSARGCAWDAAQTVRGVQAFARPRTPEGAPEVFDLNEVVRQTMEVARLKCDAIIKDSGLPLNLAVQSAGTIPVQGNAGELRQVVTNLVFNALDAMPRGGTLSVRSWRNADQAYLSVQDTGAGMAPAVLQRLFEPFFSTKGERGNGLGLSVVYGIVCRHGGEVAVDSEVGRGTKFTVQLPLSAAPTGAAAAAPGPAKPPAGLRILVVEDETAVRHYLETVLEHMGHQVRAAANARAGLDAFDAGSFDVVLTDLSLQDDSSGEEVAREIAQRAPGMPVIVLTGNASSLGANAGLPEGVSVVLGKPISMATLATTLAMFTPR
jgi:signal transduction histidine kinase